MPRPGITMPVVDTIGTLPAIAVNGSCMCMDRRGIAYNPYIYVLVPTGPATATFWRFNYATGAIFQLATPTFDANSIVGVGTAMCFDEYNQRVYLFNSQSTANPPNFDWAAWQWYNIATNAWTSLDTSTMLLGAAYGTDAALIHTDRALGFTGNPAVQERYFYLIGNAATAIQRFDTNAATWAQLAGGGGARGAAPAVGASAMWIPEQPETLYSFRGGGSNVLDSYDIPTDTWTAFATTPPIAVTTGAEYAWMQMQTGLYGIAQGGTIYGVDLSQPTFPLMQYAKVEGGDGAAHLGNGFCTSMVGPAPYVYIRPHSGTAIQRIRLIW